MTSRARHVVRLCQVAVTTTAVVFSTGCGPKVTMNVQVQDAQGNVQNFTVTNGGSSPTTIPVAFGDNITVTSTASYSDGLQKLWVEGTRTCPQQSTFVEPASGNAIPAGSSRGPRRCGNGQPDHGSVWRRAEYQSHSEGVTLRSEGQRKVV